MKKFKNFKNTMFFMVNYCKKINPSIFMAAIVENSLSAVMIILSIILPRYIIDDLVIKNSWNKIVLDIITITIAIFGISLIQKILSPWIGKSVNKSDVKTALEYNKLFADTEYSKQKNNRFRNLCEKLKLNIHVNSFAYTALGDFIKNFIVTIVFACLIIKLDVLIFCSAFLFSLLSCYIDLKQKKIKYAFDSDSSESKRKIDYISYVLLDFQYAKEIRLGQCLNIFQKKYNNAINEYKKIYRVYTKKKMILNFFDSFFNFFVQLISYTYISLAVLRGDISFGEFVMYVGIFISFLETIKKTILAINTLNYYSIYVNDYKKFISELLPDHKKNENSKLKINKENHYQIEFENVSFTYPGTNKKVLNNINVKISPGEKISIVGLNGAGKSTFIKLLCRLYYPTEGKILVNGIDSLCFSEEEYMKLISIVFQDYKLFSLSIIENIVLNQKYNEKQLNDSIEKSGLSKKIKMMSKGVNTNISKDFDDKGIELSGGESQKLVQARAIYKNAPIIILDEPTAAIDAIAERNIYENFNRIVGDKTAIYISHRLYSGKFCDRVIVFNNGKIVADGKHNNLIKENGIYNEMFSKQAMFYTKESDLNIQ